MFVGFSFVMPFFSYFFLKKLNNLPSNFPSGWTMLVSSQNHLICHEFLTVKTEESVGLVWDRTVFMGDVVLTPFQSPSGQSPL